MIETFQRLIVSQYEASLCTIAHCVVRCPDDLWHAPVAKYPFCQVAFHALFYADFYLEPSEDSLKRQPFHIANPDLFGDYEQLEHRDPVAVYERSQIKAYLDFCRGKAGAILAAETEETLKAPAKFKRRNCTRAEVHVYNIRHIQHHAGHLILRLRLDSDVNIPWIGSGWREPN